MLRTISKLYNSAIHEIQCLPHHPRNAIGAATHLTVQGVSPLNQFCMKIEEEHSSFFFFHFFSLLFCLKALRLHASRHPPQYNTAQPKGRALTKQIMTALNSLEYDERGNHHGVGQKNSQSSREKHTGSTIKKLTAALNQRTSSTIWTLHPF